MKKGIFQILAVFSPLFFLKATPALAASGDVAKIEGFITNLIQILASLAALISVVFIIIGGIGYITSAGNPETLEKSKKTILFAAIGLVIVLAAFILTSIISDLATGAFGGAI